MMFCQRFALAGAPHGASHTIFSPGISGVPLARANAAKSGSCSEATGVAAAPRTTSAALARQRWNRRPGPALNRIPLRLETAIAAKRPNIARDNFRGSRVIAMRGFFRIAVTALFSGALVVSASAQQPEAGRVATAPVFSPPFVWYGNALDQKIIDAQAQMLVPRHLRHTGRYYRRAHR